MAFPSEQQEEETQHNQNRLRYDKLHDQDIGNFKVKIILINTRKLQSKLPKNDQLEISTNVNRKTNYKYCRAFKMTFKIISYTMFI